MEGRLLKAEVGKYGRREYSLMIQVGDQSPPTDRGWWMGGVDKGYMTYCIHDVLL
jgi:hypothetical protein